MPADWPPRFTIDQEQVLNLFIGEGFYSSADASLREAVLNAIDACGRRTAAGEDGYTPRIAITFDREGLLVEIVDNGDGMGQQEVSSLFAKVGASASRLMGRAEPDRYKAVGTFGIGVISYFLVSDEFEVDTKTVGADAIGLRFTRQMLNGVTPATPRPAERTERGTSIRLHLREPRYFDLLVERFPYWVRDVPGLTATLEPEGERLAQGGPSRVVRQLTVPLPEWVDAAHIGPPREFSLWDSFDGRAKVDVLYRGVHVDRLEIPQLWGIEGSIHVDPRHFRPKLNREGFVGGELASEVQAFLRGVHPQALLAALATLREDLDSKDTSHWTLSRWVALWLAVPRTPEYAEAVKAWDGEFATRPAFRLLGPADSDTEVSITQLQKLAPPEIFVAPTGLQGAPPVVRQAVRALRGRGKTVIQGIQRDTSYLSQTQWVAQSTADLLLSYFREELPPLQPVEPIAESLVRQESVLDLYADPPVRVVRLGGDAVPVVAVGPELWINLDVPAGRQVLETLGERNEGTIGLWIACLLHAPETVQEVARVVRNPSPSPRLGPVLRQFLRSLTS